MAAVRMILLCVAAYSAFEAVQAFQGEVLKIEAATFVASETPSGAY